MGNLLDKVNTCRRRLKNLNNTFEDPYPRVLILGLDGAGKTTILYKSTLDFAIFAFTPPRGINIEIMTPRRGAKIQVYDMPGHKMTRHLWHNWFMGSEAIVFVVDSGDKVRIDEAKFELHDLLKSRFLRRVPLVVLANKQDAEEAMNTDIVSAELDLSSINDRDWSIHATHAIKGTGIMPAFNDVVDKIKAYRHYKSGLVSPDKLIKQSDIQKDIEEKPEQKTVTETIDNENIPSLFASINKQTQLEKEGNEEISEKDAELNEKGGSGSSGAGSNSAEYDRPANLGEVDVDVSSNEGGCYKEGSDEDTPANDTASNQNDTKEDSGSVEVASSVKGSDNQSERSNSLTEQALVHSAYNSDNNTNIDADSDILNNDEDTEIVEFPRRSDKVTDLDAYSDDSALDFTNDTKIDNLNTFDSQIYEFEPNARVAVI